MAMETVPVSEGQGEAMSSRVGAGPGASSTAPKIRSLKSLLESKGFKAVFEDWGRVRLTKALENDHIIVDCSRFMCSVSSMRYPIRVKVKPISDEKLVEAVNSVISDCERLNKALSTYIGVLTSLGFKIQSTISTRIEAVKEDALITIDILTNRAEMQLRLEGSASDLIDLYMRIKGG